MILIVFIWHIPSWLYKDKITHKYVFLFVHVQTLSFKNACYATSGQALEKNVKFHWNMGLNFQQEKLNFPQFLMYFFIL